MDALELFGFFTVCLSLVCYGLEERNPRLFTMGFALSCLMGSYYGFAKEAWPFGFVEIFWTVLALRKWARMRASERALVLVRSTATESRDSTRKAS